MICYPNAKINIGLHINCKRPDGYHDIETLMLPVPLCDILEILPVGNAKVPFEMGVSGIPLDCDSGDNLCRKAFDIVCLHHKLPPVKVHLHKIIPSGAGLGGGSSDAAFTIRMLNDMFALKLTHEQMISYASSIGSDCAFFIENTAAVASGRGEILVDYPYDISEYFLVLVLPDVHVSTAEAYKNCAPYLREKSIVTIASRPIHEWKNTLINDFERSVFNAYPVLEEIKKELYSMGAVYASMSGSGSAMYGLYTDLPETGKLKSQYKLYVFRNNKQI